MEKKQAYWEGLAAGYFFLSTWGVMMFVVMSLLGFFGSELAEGVNGWAGVLALIVGAIGPLLLILELGNKKKAYLLALAPPSVMTIGPIMLGAVLVIDIIYAGSFFSFVPWYGMDMLRDILAVVGSLLALGFAVYPAFELGEAQGRGFWTTGGLAPLFIVSGLATGISGVLLVAALSGLTGNPAVQTLMWALLITLIVQLVLIVSYVSGMKHAGAEEARRAAAMVASGSLSGSYKIGVLFLGTVCPIVLSLFGTNPLLVAVVAVLVLIGGASFRSVFLEAAVRKTLPGEENEHLTEEEIAELAVQLEKRWQEKAAWLNGM